jgi:hypothetical protein
MQCPLCGAEVAEHGPYVVLLEDRDGAGNESTGSHFAGEGEKDHGMAGSRKMAVRWAVEKTLDGKVKKRLSHPAWKSRKPRGIPTFPQPRRLREIN